jgi:transposase
MNQENHRKWTAAEKLRIVMAGMQKEVDVAELCRQEGIKATQYYGWKKQLLSSATRVFEDGRKKKRSGEDARREAKIHRLEKVIAEITAENLELKSIRSANTPSRAW